MIARGSIDGALELHPALRQQAFLKHLLDRLEIEIGAQIHDREIFLVEFMDRVGLFEIARDPVLEHVDEGFGVALGVHAHEGGELQEAGIDAPARAFQAHGTTPIILSRNHSIGFSLARSLTLVGEMRVSIGPAISVRLAG